MSEDEIRDRVLEFYDKLFCGFEIYDPRLARDYCRMIDQASREYEEQLREESKSLKRVNNGQS